MENRSRLVDWYINSLNPKKFMHFINAIRDGLIGVIPEYVLKDVSPETLRRLMLGPSEFDECDLENLSKTYGSGYHAIHPVSRNLNF